MKAYFIVFLSLLPTFAFSQNSKDNYSDVKDPGIYSFLTEVYKPVSDLKDLPASTEKKLEEYEKKIPE